MTKLVSFIRLYAGIVLCMLGITFVLIGSYEERIIHKFSETIVSANDEPFEKIDKLLAFTSDHYKQFEGFEVHFADVFMPGTLSQLIVPNKACGGTSEIFRALAHAQGFNTRFVQMLCSTHKESACHIIVEVQIDKTWHPVNPLYGFRFVDENKEPVTSFKEIHENWEKYQMQTPPGYNRIYDFYGRRMMNWNKNTLTRLLKKTLLLIYSEEEVLEMNPRNLVINYWYFWALLTAIAYGGIFLSTTLVLRYLNRSA